MPGKLKMLFGAGPSCQDVNGFLARYLEGVLDEKTEEQFVRHLNDCPTCNRFFEQYKATIELTREAGQIEPPPELVEKTLTFLQHRWQQNGFADNGN